MRIIMPRENEEHFLHQTLGNREAVLFVQLVFRISQFIDDVYDQDKPLTKSDMHRAFWEMMVELPSNTFYQRNFMTLQPLLQSMMLDWMDSCHLEQMGDHEKNVAFVLRDSVGAIVTHVAYLIGGYDMMNAVSLDVRQHIFEEFLEDYKDAL